MALPHGNISVNPAIAGNLRGLTDVAVEVQVELSQMPALFSKLNPVDVRKQTEERLRQVGLTVDSTAAAALVVSVATELQNIPQFNGISALFAVGSTLRELLALPRAGDDPTNSGDGRLVDSWRHKESTGIFMPQTSVEQASYVLLGECNRHVEDFVTAWLNEQAVNGPPPPPPPDEPEAPPTSDAKQAAIRAKLVEILRGLALGNKREVTLEKFEVSGSKVDFRARIRHRQVIEKFGIKSTIYDVTTRGSGSFDISAPLDADVKFCVEKPDILGGGELCVPLAALNPLLK